MYSFLELRIISITLFLKCLNLSQFSGIFECLTFLYATLRILICLLIAVVIQSESAGRILTFRLGIQSLDRAIIFSIKFLAYIFISVLRSQSQSTDDGFFVLKDYSHLVHKSKSVAHMIFVLV